MDVKTLERIRKQEGSSRNELTNLPSNYYDDCQEALDYAFKTNNYDEFMNLQILIRHINERRISKLLNFAVYRSTPNRMLYAEPVRNILPEEQKLLDNFLSCIDKFNNDLDVRLNGYLFQEVSR